MTDFLEKKLEEARTLYLEQNAQAIIAFGGGSSMDALTHAVAHSLGGQYGTPHGLANAVLLPVVLREYGEACEKKLSKLAREAKVVEEGLSDYETAQLFIEWMDQEGDPLYPVPVFMNRKEQEKIYHRVKSA